MWGKHGIAPPGLLLSSGRGRAIASDASLIHHGLHGGVLAPAGLVGVQLWPWTLS